jgi:hypothetical protein
LFFWDKDLKTAARSDIIDDNHVMICTDVDYYLDMGYQMGYGIPIMLYTVVPQKAAHRGVDSCYHIENDNIIYEVAGGGKYQHKIWDYDRDTFRAKLHYGPYAGDTMIYDVEQKIVKGEGTDHRLVLLVPTFRVPACLASVMPGCKEIHYRKYTKHGVNTVFEPVQGNISMALNGSRDAVDIPSRLLRAVTARLRGKTTAFLVGDIEVFLQDHFRDTSKVDAALLYEILTQTGLAIEYTPNVIHTNALITNYRPVASAPLEEEKPVGLAVTTPLVAQPALFAARCRDADEVAVRGRVTNVANNAIPPLRYEAYEKEFVEFLVPNPGVGTPITLQSVIDEQSRPAQRSRTEQALHLLGLGGRNKLKTFIKAEAYSSVSDPRIITTCSTDLTIGMSRYTYAFKRANLKRQPWYGPGMTPVKIAKRLALLCQQSTIETDYSRFDGTISQFLQGVAQRAYTRWLVPSEVPVMLKHYEEVFRKSAVSQNGYRYSAGVGTRSGSPITTDANTMINAFVNYCAYRSIGLGPHEAYKALGLYAGDDGVSRNVPGFSKGLEEVCKELGLSVKAQENAPNTRTTMLSRVFPRPVTSRTSYQCVKRTLPKLHLSANKGMSREQAAYNRAVGYLTTDGLTPLVSDWCRKVVEVTGLQTSKGMTGEEVHKMSEAWPQDENDVDMIRESVAADLGITTSELEERAAAIRNADSLDDIPVVWNNTREVKVTAIVGDELMHKPGQSIKTWNEDKQTKTTTTTSSTPSMRHGERTPNRQRAFSAASSNKQSNQRANLAKVGPTNQETAQRTATSAHNRRPSETDGHGTDRGRELGSPAPLGPRKLSLQVRSGRGPRSAPTKGPHDRDARSARVDPRKTAGSANGSGR